MLKTTGQVCKELDTKPYKVDYLIRNRLVPEPSKLASGQRVFTDEDIKRIEEKLFEMKAR